MIPMQARMKEGLVIPCLNIFFLACRGIASVSESTTSPTAFLPSLVLLFTPGPVCTVFLPGFLCSACPLWVCINFWPGLHSRLFLRFSCSFHLHQVCSELGYLAMSCFGLTSLCLPLTFISDYSQHLNDWKITFSWFPSAPPIAVTCHYSYTPAVC